MRSERDWMRLGSDDLAADMHSDTDEPGITDEALGEVLAAHHEADLADPDVTEQTDEARAAAVDALVRGYVGAWS